VKYERNQFSWKAGVRSAERGRTEHLLEADEVGDDLGGGQKRDEDVQGEPDGAGARVGREEERDA
jgi:hypothetical protein